MNSATNITPKSSPAAATDRTKPNAFALLMSGKKSPAPKRTGPSNFVKCPSCDLSFSYTNINLHLDKCVAETAPTIDAGISVTDDTDAAEKGPSLQTLKSKEYENDDVPKHDSRQSNPVESTTSILVDEGRVGKRLNSDDSDQLETSPHKKDVNPSVAPESSKKRKNAFNHMMQNAKKVYDDASKKVEKQRFHLSRVDGQFHLQWICNGEDSKIDMGADSNEHWSGKVMIYASKEEKAGNDSASDIELSITSSIASGSQFERKPFVRNPSKLSVSQRALICFYECSFLYILTVKYIIGSSPEVHSSKIN